MFTLKKDKIFLFASISGLLTVALGAFAAHSLKGLLLELNTYESFKTGILYQMFHTVVLLILSFLVDKNFSKKLQIASLFFIIGILLFSFSLYIYSLSKIRLFAFITPVGGVSFLFAWFYLILEYFQARK